MKMHGYFVQDHHAAMIRSEFDKYLVTRNNASLCQQNSENFCHRVSAMNCTACKSNIKERFFLKVADKIWHINCLKCWICRVELHTEISCFIKDGVIYCKEDYNRLFGRKCCIRCGIKIMYDELVMKVKNLVFHVTCFCCVQCGRMLNPGEYFGLKGLLPFCQDDLMKNSMNINEDFIHDLQKEHSNATGTIPHFFLFHQLSRVNNFYHSSLNDPHNFHSAIPKVRGKKKRKCNELDNLYEVSEDFRIGNASRQKRMRTSFKHHQLRAMKSYFALNHNPDAKDLKSLSEKTGLSKRVLQVWFQNARAKYRRNISRNENTSQSSLKDAKSVEDDSELGTYSKDDDVNDSSSNIDNEEIYMDEDDSDILDPEDDISNESHSKIPCLQYLNRNSSPEISELSCSSTVGPETNISFDNVEKNGDIFHSLVNDIGQNVSRLLSAPSSIYANL